MGSKESLSEEGLHLPINNYEYLQNVKDNNKVIIDLSGYIRRPIP